MPETAQEAYSRGMEMGVVNTRLDHHDAEIKATNTVLARVVEVEATLTMAVQSLTAARVTDAETRVATATAVKDADEVRRRAADITWSPFQKFLTTLAVVVSLVGLYFLSGR